MRSDALAFTSRVVSVWDGLPEAKTASMIDTGDNKSSIGLYYPQRAEKLLNVHIDDSLRGHLAVEYLSEPPGLYFRLSMS